MQLSMMLTKQILQLFVIMLCGFLIVRLGMLPSDSSKVLSKVNTFVITPCMCIQSFQIEYTPERVYDLLLLLALGFATHLLFMLITGLLKGPLKLSPMERASLVFTNCGMIIPLVPALFGQTLLFGVHGYGLAQVTLIWTYGSWVISGHGEATLKKLLNINILAIFLGLVLFLMQVRLPSILVDSMGSLGSMMGPINMLVIGMLIGGVNLKAVFCDRRAYWVVALRLLLYPLILVLLFRITGIVRLASTPLLLAITTLAAAAPSAATIISIAQVKDINTDMAVRINIISTVLCIFTMPLLLQIYQWLLV